MKELAVSLLLSMLCLGVFASSQTTAPSPQANPTPQASPQASPAPQPNATPGAGDQAKGDSNDKIQDNLQSVLSGDPILSGASVQAQVDDQSITLTGTVESYAQHQRALQLVQPYASSRKVVDKVKTTNSQQ